MTREEAIQVLNMVEAHGLADEAKHMAIEALQREEAEANGYCHRIIPSNVEVVVRCKDCKQRRVEGDCTHYYYCDFMGSMCGDNEYCSFGERREP